MIDQNTASSNGQAVGSIEQVVEAVGDLECLIPRGGGTKTALTHTAGDAQILDLRGLSGILQYDPSEYTITVRAGTMIREIAAALRSNGQYFPPDPILPDSGATIGGTVASGLSGSGRMRYGGVRDFVLGVQLVTGDGRLVRGGGRVVKNAAGFDLPKLMCGSIGRLGIITELTLKVFPRPPIVRGVAVTCETAADAAEVLDIAARSVWELDAADYHPHDQKVYLRIAGSDRGTSELIERMGSRLNDLDPKFRCRRQADESAGHDATGGDTTIWQRSAALNWQPDNIAVAKLNVPQHLFLPLQSFCDGRSDSCCHYSAAGGVAWFSVNQTDGMTAVTDWCQQNKCDGTWVLGTPQRLRLGPTADTSVSSRIAAVMDPPGRFPPLPN